MLKIFMQQGAFFSRVYSFVLCVSMHYIKAMWFIVPPTSALSLGDSKAGESMKATLRYLAGIAGPSALSSNSTAEQVTEECFSLWDL